MKKLKRKKKKQKLHRRRQAKLKLIFHYPLSLLPEERVRREAQFFSSYTTVGQWLVETQERELRKRSCAIREEHRELRRKQEATMRALEIIREISLHFDERTFDPVATKNRLLATGLSEKEIRELFERSIRSPSRSEERKLKDQESELLREGAKWRIENERLRREQRYRGDGKIVLDSLLRLYDAAFQRGEEAAAAELLDVAQMSCALLDVVASRKPELVRARARMVQSWPLLVNLTPTSKDKTAQRLTNLQVGADTIFGRLRLDKAFSEITPARRYARVLIETIWMNKLLLPQLAERLRAMAAVDSKHMYNFEDLPGWLKLVAALPPFSLSTVKAWAATARMMLRTEYPDFHLRGEWSSVRRAFQSSERGRIQNKILDKIASAMRTIAKGERGD